MPSPADGQGPELKPGEPRSAANVRAGTIGAWPVPVDAASEGKPDGRADFGGFVILNEVTTVRHLNKADIEDQWDSARTHVAEAVTDRPRIYCFMVSRLGLDGYDGRKPRRKWQPAALAEAQETHGALKAGATVKFLVFDFEDVSEIAHKLHWLYGDPDRRGKPEALTEEALGRILDRLHAMAMERIGAGEDFGIGWASTAFVKMLDNHAKGHPLEGKPPKKRKRLEAGPGGLGLGRETPLRCGAAVPRLILVGRSGSNREESR